MAGSAPGFRVLDATAFHRSLRCRRVLSAATCSRRSGALAAAAPQDGLPSPRAPRRGRRPRTVKADDDETAPLSLSALSRAQRQHEAASLEHLAGGGRQLSASAEVTQPPQWLTGSEQPGSASGCEAQGTQDHVNAFPQAAGPWEADGPCTASAAETAPKSAAPTALREPRGGRGSASTWSSGEKAAPEAYASSSAASSKRPETGISTASNSAASSTTATSNSAASSTTATSTTATSTSSAASSGETASGAGRPSSRSTAAAVSGSGSGFESGPRHPPVAFRTAGELRRMLQERQSAATGHQVGVRNVDSSSDPGGGGGGDGGRGSGSARPPALPPRRFFTPPSAPSTPAGGELPAESSGAPQRESSSLPLARQAPRQFLQRLPRRQPQQQPAPSGRVTHLPWRSGTAEAAKAEAETVSENQLELDKDYQKAKRYALTMLQRTPLASGDLFRRLLERGHERHKVAALVRWLGANGALDDALFARLYVRSKWNNNLSAPAKIQTELVAQGVAAADVAAALAHVFGPSRRIQLTGPATADEKEVRETLLEAARRQAAHRPGSQPGAADGGGKVRGCGKDGANAAAEQFKERDAKRRRLGMWLLYRGHEMDVVKKVFGLLRM